MILEQNIYDSNLGNSILKEFTQYIIIFKKDNLFHYLHLYHIYALN